jgi:hypothetical protein
MAELIQLEVIVVMLCTGFGNLVLEKVTKWSINHSHIIKKSHIPTFTYDHLSSHQSSSINQHQQHHVSTSYLHTVPKTRTAHLSHSSPSKYNRDNL